MFRCLLEAMSGAQGACREGGRSPKMTRGKSRQGLCGLRSSPISWSWSCWLVGGGREERRSETMEEVLAELARPKAPARRGKKGKTGHGGHGLRVFFPLQPGPRETTTTCLWAWGWGPREIGPGQLKKQLKHDNPERRLASSRGVGPHNGRPVRRRRVVAPAQHPQVRDAGDLYAADPGRNLRPRLLLLLLLDHGQLVALVRPGSVGLGGAGGQGAELEPGD